MRNESWTLMLPPLGIMLTGLGILLLRQQGMGHPILEQLVELPYIPWMCVCILLAALIQFVLLHSRPPADPWMFPTALFLTSIGLMMLARLKMELLPAQLKWLCIGMLLFLLML
ncbi:MAG: FtsW/RodA/SpoVE family cell cycle protein, partial [Selenomonadaceae bacterium]|nr:FtsW/RodA/SpoVE family cell cycle protein [Selenomonadaceae bacterium]